MASLHETLKGKSVFKDTVLEATLDLETLREIPCIAHKLQKIKRDGKVCFFKNGNIFKLKGPDREMHKTHTYLLANVSIHDILISGIENEEEIREVLQGVAWGKFEGTRCEKHVLELRVSAFVTLASKHSNNIKQKLQTYRSEMYVTEIENDRIIIAIKGPPVGVETVEKYVAQACDEINQTIDVHSQKVSVDDRLVFLDDIQRKFQPNFTVMHGVNLYLVFPRYSLATHLDIDKDISTLERLNEREQIQEQSLKNLLERLVESADNHRTNHEPKEAGCIKDVSTSIPNQSSKTLAIANDTFGKREKQLFSESIRNSFEQTERVGTPNSNDSEHVSEEIEVTHESNAIINENRAFLERKAEEYDIKLSFVADTKFNIEGKKANVNSFVNSVKGSFRLNLIPKEMNGFPRKSTHLEQQRSPSPMSFSSQSWQKFSFSDGDLSSLKPNTADNLASSFTRYCHPSTGIKIHVGISDITKMDTDCIVNAANSDLQHYGGVAYAIAKGAGYQLEDECFEFIKKHGSLKVAEVCATTGGHLPCKKVLHTVGPIWSTYIGNGDCTDQLQEVFSNCLNYAEDLQMTSIAFPAISAGIYGVPTYQVTRAACEAICVFFLCHSEKKSCIRDIYFVALAQDTIDSFNAVFNIQVSEGVFLKEE